MRKFNVTLHRAYFVEIEAENESDAKSLAEYFLSTPIDDSSKKEHEAHGFRIGNIELVSNDATEVQELILATKES